MSSLAAFTLYFVMATARPLPRLSSYTKETCITTHYTAALDGYKGAG